MKKIVLYVLEIVGLVFTYLGNQRAKSKQKKLDDAQD